MARASPGRREDDTMKIPVLSGVITRRILVNLRVEAEVAARLLPPPLRPKLVRGKSIAGICLIRLERIRPRGFPTALGLSSENLAHRFAVEWWEGGERREGVYIARRDTSSLLNALAGGRVFPTEFHHARFDVVEDASLLRLRVASDDGGGDVEIAGRVARELPHTSIFDSMDEISRFFEAGSVGYQATVRGERLDGVELRSLGWRVEPFAIETARSAFFEDRARFPEGTIELDSALIMRDVEHEWHARQALRVAGARRDP
jgi:hypothetical protein